MITNQNISIDTSHEYNDIIDYWLSLRQQVLIDYGKVAGLSPDHKQCLPSIAELNEFCATLVDYISAGHFRIYNMIMERWEKNGFKTNPDIDALYFKIVETTEPLLNFNDKYSNFTPTEDNANTVDQDISSVGQVIEFRFAKEDALIEMIAGSLMTRS